MLGTVHIVASVVVQRKGSIISFVMQSSEIVFSLTSEHLYYPDYNKYKMIVSFMK